MASDDEPKKLISHKQRRQLLKKDKRRQRRIALAKQREKEQIEETEVIIKEYGSLDVYEEIQSKKEKEAEEQRISLHSKWLENEKKFREELRARQELVKRLQEEEKQRAEASLAEKNQRIEEDVYTSGSDTNEELQSSRPLQNPFPPSSDRTIHAAHDIRDDTVKCSFFVKTGVCRFGIRCSRSHVYPQISRFLLVPNMFTSIGLSEGLQDEQEFDTNLEYSEVDLQSQFMEFYNDVYPQFQSIGEIVEFKVCCNYEPHLRGNVYIEYKSESDCERALRTFSGRWYAQRKLTCTYASISNWKSAICGLFRRKRCPKGKHCNFLHVFENPSLHYSTVSNKDRYDHRSKSHSRISNYDSNTSSSRKRHSDRYHDNENYLQRRHSDARYSRDTSPHRHKRRNYEDSNRTDDRTYSRSSLRREDKGSYESKRKNRRHKRRSSSPLTSNQMDRHEHVKSKHGKHHKDRKSSRKHRKQSSL